MSTRKKRVRKPIVSRTLQEARKRAFKKLKPRLLKKEAKKKNTNSTGPRLR